MEDLHRHCCNSSCYTCLTTQNRRTWKIRRMPTSSSFLMVTMALSLYVAEAVSAETLCGGELVDALQFVCGFRGFYFSRPTSRWNNRRSQKGIVEECCFKRCSLSLLEQYCAKPAKSERDVSATSVQSTPLVLPVVYQDAPRKPLIVKYSKYEIWQRKAAQRLRRWIPSILRSKKSRQQPGKSTANKRDFVHRPLIALPSELPPTENRVTK
ncbi:insulin-like growth factor II [Arapaima gigas]